MRISSAESSRARCCRFFGYLCPLVLRTRPDLHLDLAVIQNGNYMNRTVAVTRPDSTIVDLCNS